MSSFNQLFRKGIWIVAFALLSGVLTAQGATLLDEPFDTPGGLPEGWASVNSSGNALIEVKSYESGKARLLQGRQGGSGTAAGSLIYYSGTQGDVVNGKLQNFEGSVVFAIKGTHESHYRGVLVRAQTTGISNSQSYFIVFNSNSLMITLNPASSSDIGEVLSRTSFLDDIRLAENTDYLLKFSAAEDHLKASIYAWDDGTGQYDILLGDVSYTTGTNENDPGYVSGKFGFRAHYGSAAETHWSDLSISPIPEPSSLAFYGLTLLLAFFQVRKTKGS